MKRNFEYVGFHPRQEFRQYSKTVLNQILDRAPCDATVSGSIEQKEDSFVFQIRIKSSCGDFAADYCVAKSALPGDRSWPAIGLENLSSQIFEQFNKWNSERKLAA